MTTKSHELRTSVKLRKSTVRMVRETGIFGDTIDELIRRLLFIKKTGKEGKTSVESKVERLL